MLLLLRSNVTPSTIFLVNNANTSVADLGGNTWRITKTGSNSLYDASAVGTGYFAGDFSIRVRKVSVTDNFGIGVTSDPLADNDWASIDFAILYDVSDVWVPRENGANVGNMGSAGANDVFLWRTSGVVGYGIAANLAAAQAAPYRTIANSANLYFDSSLNGPGTIIEVLLSGTTSSSTTFTATISGGLQTGGTAAKSRTIAKTTSGGVQLAGSATTSRLAVKTYTPSGGITLVGAAAAARVVVRTVTPSGGMTFAGAAVLSRTEDVSPLGGLTFAGTALRARTVAPSASGGLLAAGSASVSTTRVQTASGGAQFAGEALVSRARIGVTSGGLSFSGAAATSYAAPSEGETFEFSASGGAVFAGSAETIYTAAPVQTTPGSSTALAPSLRRATPKTYAYKGSGGLSFGGSAETDFLPKITWSFDGTGQATIGGSAATEFFDPYVTARAEDEELLFIG